MQRGTPGIAAGAAAAGGGLPLSPPALSSPPLPPLLLPGCRSSSVPASVAPGWSVPSTGGCRLTRAIACSPILHTLHPASVKPQWRAEYSPPWHCECGVHGWKACRGLQQLVHPQISGWACERLLWQVRTSASQGRQRPHGSQQHPPTSAHNSAAPHWGRAAGAGWAWAAPVLSPRWPAVRWGARRTVAEVAVHPHRPPPQLHR